MLTAWAMVYLPAFGPGFKIAYVILSLFWWCVPSCRLQVPLWFRIYHPGCRLCVNPGTTSTPMSFPTSDHGWVSVLRIEMWSARHSVFCSYSLAETNCKEVLVCRNIFAMAESIIKGLNDPNGTQVVVSLRNLCYFVIGQPFYCSESPFPCLFHTGMWRVIVLNVRCPWILSKRELFSFSF